MLRYIMNPGTLLKNYARILTPIVREAFVLLWRKIVMLFVVSTLCVLTISTSFAGFFLIINEWIKENGINLFFMTLDLSGNIPLTITLSTMLLALGILGAWGTYIIKKMIAGITVRYQQSCCLTILDKIAQPEYQGWQGFFSSSVKQGISSLMNKDIRMRAHILKEILEGILPALTFVVATVVMFIVSVHLSILVGLSTLLFLPSFININTRTVRLQREFEKSGSVYREHYTERLKMLMEVNNSANIDAFAEFIRSSAFFQPRFLFLRRFIQGEKMQALNSTYFVSMLYLLIIFFIVASGNDNVEWEKLLIFGIAFRFCLNSFRSVASIIVTSGRFYAGAERYHNFHAYCTQLYQTNQNTNLLNLKKFYVTVLRQHQKTDAETLFLSPGELYYMHIEPPINTEEIKRYVMKLHDASNQSSNPLLQTTIIKVLSPIQSDELQSAMDKGLLSLLERARETGDMHTLQRYSPEAQVPLLSASTTLLINCLNGNLFKGQLFFISSHVLTKPVYRIIRRLVALDDSSLFFIVTNNRILTKPLEGFKYPDFLFTCQNGQLKISDVETTLHQPLIKHNVDNTDDLED